MENSIIQEKTNKTEAQTTQYRHKRNGAYAKVQDDIYDLFDQHGITAPHAMIYMALSGCLIHNSEFARASYKTLRKKGRASSDETVSNALKELSDKGFISKMGNSTYRLWHCVYKGMREDEIDYSEVENPRIDGTTANVVKPTTANVVPHARVLLSKQHKKLQQETVDVDFKNLTFGENSRFKDEIPQLQWNQWIQKYTLEWCQTMIMDLEYSYREDPGKIRTPKKLMLRGLIEGRDWKIEEQRDDKIKKREYECEAKKALERRNQEIWDEESAQRDEQTHRDAEDYALAIKQPYIITRAEQELRMEAPELNDAHELFGIRLRFKILAIYRQGLN